MAISLLFLSLVKDCHVGTEGGNRTADVVLVDSSAVTSP
jgi:hypothetical protein